MTRVFTYEILYLTTMELIKNLELKDFLNPDSDSYIVCYLNDIRLLNMESHDPLYGFFYSFHQGSYLGFMEIKKESSRILPLDKDCVVTYQGEVVDLTKLRDLFVNTKKRWVKEFSMPFPDILISGNPKLHKNTASISIDNEKYEHIIYFPVEYINNLDKMEYVLGHELGHLYFRKVLRPYHDSFLNKKVYTNPAFIKILLFLIALTPLFFIKNQNLVILGALGSATFSLTLFYFIASTLSYKERIEKYNEEFFSDYFSFHFMGVKDLRYLSLLEGEHNLWTHPSGDTRRHLLYNFIKAPLKDWQSPVKHHPQLFFSASAYEISFFYSRIINFYIKKLEKLLRIKP